MIPITPAGKYDHPPLPHRLRQKFLAHPTLIFLPFAAGYFLSYLFRTANGPLAGQLIGTFGLGPGDLGVLTALYFLTFAAFQIPAGVLIDRFGPRRVQASLMLVAAGGVFTFAAAHGWTLLMLGRAMMGLGCSASLVTGVKALTLWLPRERRAIGNCCLIMCGGLGAIASTAPLHAVVDHLGWRATFVLLGFGALAAAALVWIFVPEQARETTSAENAENPAGRESIGAILRGMETILRDRRFWRVAPLSASVVGAAFAIHGLWAARWLADVARLTQAEINAVMLTMGVGLTLGAIGFGALAAALRRRGVSTTTLFGGACLVFLALQTAIVVAPELPPTLAFGAFAPFGAITVLSFTIVGELFPGEMTGRANGALNVLHLGGAFVMQAGIGAIVALWPAGAGGHAPRAAYVTAVATVMAIQAAALAWFAHAAPRATKPRLVLVGHGTVEYPPA